MHQRGFLAGDVIGGYGFDVNRDRRSPAPKRSTTARSTERIDDSLFRSMKMRASSTPIAAAATSAPSSTRCGTYLSNISSLRLAGSPSLPLITTMGRVRPRLTVRILRPVGKAPPPRPRKPALSTADMYDSSGRLPGNGGIGYRQAMTSQFDPTLLGADPGKQSGKARCGRGGIDHVHVGIDQGLVVRSDVVVVGSLPTRLERPAHQPRTYQQRYDDHERDRPLRVSGVAGGLATSRQVTAARTVKAQAPQSHHIHG